MRLDSHFKIPEHRYLRHLHCSSLLSGKYFSHAKTFDQQSYLSIEVLECKFTISIRRIRSPGEFVKPCFIFIPHGFLVSEYRREVVKGTSCYSCSDDAYDCISYFADNFFTFCKRVFNFPVVLLT